MNSQYICSHCDELGGEPLGNDRDGNSVCTKCGFIDAYGKPTHNSEWRWDNTTAYNKTLTEEILPSITKKENSNND